MVFVVGHIKIIITKNPTEIGGRFLKKYVTNTENIPQTDKVRESKSVNGEV